jgi:hypothetical protein
MLNEVNQIHNFISSSGSGIVFNYGSDSGSDFLKSYGSSSGSTSQKYASSGSGSGSGSATLLITLVHNVSGGGKYTVGTTCINISIH